MLKKIGLTVLLFALAACGQTTSFKAANIFQPRNLYRPYDNFGDYSAQSEQSKDAFEVAMLLPLSGKSASYGKGMQNAAMMALEDANNHKLSVRFYDTKSSSEGAQNALSEALKNNAKLILGPLTSDEVMAVSSLARTRRIPVISFSTAPYVLGDGVYTLGLLPDEQIRRIISYAAQNGRLKIALVLPDTPAGLNIAKSALDAASENNISITKIGFYEPSTLEFSQLVQDMIKNPDFDSILIAETGNRLKAIASTFGYFDVAYPDVLFLGTSVWENTSLSKETTLFKGLYPAISRVHNDYFTKKYTELFGEHPNNLYSLAYDGIALASALSFNKDGYLHEHITNPDGYIGINGAFRLFANGTNEHALDVVEVGAKGGKTVSTAPKKFAPKTYRPTYTSNTRPEIYGKDANVVYQKLFPAQTPSYFYMW
ncbi:MAG: penicillin-binding protein activator [Alphaproteobacteria bacterium]|nr:penicillin-binding protein activator [Alphaproteobacteria bacterium]